MIYDISYHCFELSQNQMKTRNSVIVRLSKRCQIAKRSDLRIDFTDFSEASVIKYHPLRYRDSVSLFYIKTRLDDDELIIIVKIILLLHYCLHEARSSLCPTLRNFLTKSQSTSTVLPPGSANLKRSFA